MFGSLFLSFALHCINMKIVGSARYYYWGPRKGFALATHVVDVYGSETRRPHIVLLLLLLSPWHYIRANAKVNDTAVGWWVGCACSCIIEVDHIVQLHTQQY